MSKSIFKECSTYRDYLFEKEKYKSLGGIIAIPAMHSLESGYEYCSLVLKDETVINLHWNFFGKKLTCQVVYPPTIEYMYELFLIHRDHAEIIGFDTGWNDNYGFVCYCNFAEEKCIKVAMTVPIDAYTTDINIRDMYSYLKDEKFETKFIPKKYLLLK